MFPSYTRPHSLPELIEALSSAPGGFVLAGGTDLMVQMRLGLRHPTFVADVGDIAPMHRLDSEPVPTLGAAVTIRSLLSTPALRTGFPALAQAGSLLGGRQIQAMATIGGNLCNASPAAETATPLLVYDGLAVIAGSSGERSVPLTEFWLGPGQTVLAQGEVLVGVRLPGVPFGPHSAYRRLELRRSVDIAIVSASAALDISDHVISGARVAVGAVAPTPRRVSLAEQALVGAEVPASNDGGVPEALMRRVNEAAAECRNDAQPIDDVRASAEYRGAMLEVIARRAILGSLGFENPGT